MKYPFVTWNQERIKVRLLWIMWKYWKPVEYEVNIFVRISRITCWAHIYQKKVWEKKSEKGVYWFLFSTTKWIGSDSKWNIRAVTAFSPTNKSIDCLVLDEILVGFFINIFVFRWKYESYDSYSYLFRQDEWSCKIVGDTEQYYFLFS